MANPIDVCRGKREVEQFLAKYHEEWRTIPWTFIPGTVEERTEEQRLNYGCRVWHWVKTGQILPEEEAHERDEGSSEILSEAV